MMSLVADTPASGVCTAEQAFAKHLIPPSTSTYGAVPNEELVLMLNEAARQQGVVLTEEKLAMDLKGQRFFGTYAVEGLDIHGGRVKLMLGFCNSYNKSLRVRICFGGRVFVCSNLCFYAWDDDETGIVGEVGHRHTVNVSDGLWQRLETGLSQIENFRKEQNRFYESLVQAQLSKNDAYSLIIKAAKDGVLNKSRILDVANEWDYQRNIPDTEEQYLREWHQDFRERTAYALFNAFTQNEKPRHEKNPVASSMDTLALSRFFHKEFVS